MKPHRQFPFVAPPIRPKTAAWRAIPQFTDRYSRWPELGLHQTLAFLLSPAICEREGCETFFAVAGLVTV
jgi:hypothetical protein